MPSLGSKARSAGEEAAGISLRGKRILFVAVRDFGYASQIEGELRRRGADVDYLPDRPFDKPFLSAVTRYARPTVMPFADRYYFRRLAELGDKDYDLVLVTNGVTVSQKLMAELRRRLPRARFVFYIWDSMENRPSAPGILPFFDEAVTFDPHAARAYGMRLQPLFFAPGFEAGDAVEIEYDLSFIGTAHSDRYHIISTLDAKLGGGIKRYWYLFLKAGWVYYAEKRFNPAFRRAKISDFKYEPLAFANVQRVFKQSRVIVDIEHPNQRGLTMRTFESIGAEKKLITTNRHVRDYAFFDPNNIHVIDRDNPSVPEDFLTSPYRPLPDDLYRQHSLAGWVDTLLGSGEEHATATRA